MWANDSTRQLQSNPPWHGWVSEEARAEYAKQGWKEVGNGYELPVLLNELQENKWQEVKVEREKEQYKPLIYNNLIFDFDKKSQDALAGAISAAQASLILSIPFPEVEWTLADNTKTIVTVNDLMAILFKGIQRTNSIFAYARILREDIFSENATVKSVENIKWSYVGEL